MKSDTRFKTANGDELAATIYSPEEKPTNKAVIYAHGFKGFKDWGFVPYIGEFLSEAGFLVVTFNFSHNGIGDNLLEFTEQAKFAQNTFSREIQELSEIIDACKSGKFGPVHNIGVLGHSRGGGIALLTAVKKSLVEAVSTWSAVSTFDRYNKSIKKAWRKKGYFEVANKRTGQIMRLNTTLLDDVEQNGAERLNIAKAVTKLNKPLQIIHGTEDEGVPLSDAEKLFSWADKGKTEFHQIRNTGHTFGAVHPFTGSNDKLDSVLGKTAQFFKKHL